MKLTRLRLIGFKSFVEPTDFLIEPGLTGVVGPNGCGKSNLVEALRWVMGETSHKSMRAAEMDDVIFSGNNNRPPRNTAEVAIQIDNAEARGADAVQRARHARHLAPDRAREGLALPHQRPRGARPRRDDAVRRRLDRLALARAGASGPHRRDHPGQARAAPPRAGRGRRHFRPARPPPRGRAAAEGRRDQPAARRRRGQPAWPARSTRSSARRGRRSATATSRPRCARSRRRCIICAGSAPMPRSTKSERAKDLSVRAVADATIAQSEAGKGREAAAAARAAAARSRGARRRRAAAPADRPRHARRRGDPRPRTPRRTRPAAGAVRRGRRARTRAGRRRRSRARAARAGRRDAAAARRGPAPSGAPASMPAWPRPTRSSPSGKDLRRTDRRSSPTSPRAATS